jgi:hypothetical protein
MSVMHDCPLSPNLQDILTDIRAAAHVAARRARRARAVRRALVAAAFALVGTTVAAAAAGVIGRPAPDFVKRDLAHVDQGLPADLRVNPDIAHAHAVAATATSTLYLAELRDGGYCLEIVTSGDRGRGTPCTTAPRLGELPIEVSLPSDTPARPDAPVTLGGRVNAGNATTLEILYTDGTHDAIPLAPGRFFVFDVPSGHVKLTHGSQMILIARDATGAEAARGVIPADWDANPDQAPQPPIEVSTRSNESDVSRVLGIEGSVHAPGAVSLELRYPNGQTDQIPLDAAGHYDYTLPAARQGDLYRRPGALIARDSSGQPLAETPVAAVAYWRGRERRFG